MSSIVNKVKDALHHDKSQETKTGTHGPHDSKAANVADPRVDSDRDHRANPASATGANTHATNPSMAGHGNAHGATSTTGTSGLGSTGTTGTGMTGSHGTSGMTSSNNYGSSGLGSTGTSTNSGPHGSNMMNKADPRVDSDRDHRAAPGGMTGSNNYGSSGLGSTGTTGTGMTGSHGTSGMTSSHTSGMTGSNNYGSSGLGSTGTTGTGMTGSHGTTGGLGGTGPGPANNTAGPHKSDMMNKVDPRVDSDLDGSKTVGQDKTYQRSSATTGTHMSKDPTDAAQVPPSVMRKTLGDPVVEHDDHLHARDERHRRASAQEDFRGV
ncbi:hypothetical protein MGG_09261 [Pyricularia oryzae 70-15]|uniref:Period circadian protein n=1 Tax=Pyricularia oryzae (strain 70-15 / ATCC MYA-4617 / FGSC 8958) TaxID=242507 RepID=G4MQ89_PYRO7|nr:uncharacterized protein MGG_09261 [Pyricularia oryzae 70-15]EHA57282.1 hypothetical protein MGG_09261 [Pyricularia oryzae 70-15]KAI7923111.1 hypothetical protein M0657_005289 [Pyricularia oryzae]KAI7926023.1 hypothetical protein M9X92_002979 [Pyricularia oryzae]